MRRRTAIIALAAACSTLPNSVLAQDATSQAATNVSGPAAGDPWEPMNRAFFGVSNFVDKLIFRPVAMTYRRVLPRFVRTAAHNVVSNLEEPGTVINDALQGKFKRAATSSARFLTNTTIGVAGIFDVAAPMGFVKHDNDFGLTLGKWNLEAGPYLYVPLAGPSSVRDLTGRVVDTLLDPISMLEFRDDHYFHTSRIAINVLDTRVAVEPQLKQLDKMAVDPYASLRSIYLQSRESKVQDGVVDVDALPDFPDSDFSGDGAGAKTELGPIVEPPLGDPAVVDQAAADQPTPALQPVQ